MIIESMKHYLNSVNYKRKYRVILHIQIFLRIEKKDLFLANNQSGLVFICSCLEWHIYAVCIGPGNYLLVPIILAKYLEIMLIFGVFLFVLCDINTWPRNSLSLKSMKIFQYLF